VSYCRWSSMNWACDLYIYADVSGGWTIHVAGRRRVGPLPPEADWDLIKPGHSEADMAEFMRQYRANMDAVSAAESVDIALHHAGETFSLPDPGECADKVEELVSLGYICPDYVVADLREEQAEMDKAAA
jgi:hypothetical protein